MRNRLIYFVVLVILSINASAQERTVVNISAAVANTQSFVDKEVIVDGKTDLHVLAKYTPLSNSIIRLNSEDSWLFFDNIRPQSIIDSVLPNIYINGNKGVYKNNVRVSIYKQGAVVIPQGSEFQPIELYSGQNYLGESQKYGLYTYNNALGTFDNKARSFKLKRGYMATLANNADGTGYSRVYIADNADIEVPIMPAYLDNTVSFIRVFNWEWVTKKGWCQSGTKSGGDAASNTNKMNGTWLYDWSAGNYSRPNFEYVPIKQEQFWPSWTQINELKNVSHLIGYNEPDHTEQSNVSVATAVKEWPNYLKTGLRLGSPATTDFNWLYQFMDSCKAHNYRVDFIVVHAYWGGLTPTQWYNQLKAVHEKTGRGIWIKEWNNGADWTTESWPTSYGDGLTKQYNDLKGILNVMDTAHFVERYSIYNWVGSMRMMIADDGWITPAGEYYRDNNSNIAFNRSNEIIPSYKFSSSTAELSVTAGTNAAQLTLNCSGADQEFTKEIVVEKKAENGVFNEIYRTNQSSQFSYTDTHNVNSTGRFYYRLRLLLSNGTEVKTNEQSFDVISGEDIQYGTLNFADVDWNPIYFKNNYNAIPMVITGSATNNNTEVLLTPKVKTGSYKMFSFQLAPWNYQNVSKLSTDETIPYFIINPGSYNLGGLKVEAAKTIVGKDWGMINFTNVFDSIPVVFVSQATSSNPIPTTLRIRNVSKTGFEVKLQKESKISTTLSSELFSYVAIEPGVGVVNNNKLYVGKTDENAVGNSITQFARIDYPETIEKPVFIAQMQTCNDDTVCATLRYRSVLNTQARIFKQRELSSWNTVSAYETAGYMLINTDVIQAVNSPELNQLSIYPNPVTDKLFLVKNSVGSIDVQIYSLYGALVKAESSTTNSIDVSNLLPGYYILKAEGYRNTKFIKY
ncbi:MAG: glycosyl hydrolase [Paludibacter sp.]|nr:glycosyl hydrolase [Paludibacter sp.]